MSAILDHDKFSDIISWDQGDVQMMDMTGVPNEKIIRIKERGRSQPRTDKKDKT